MASQSNTSAELARAGANVASSAGRGRCSSRGAIRSAPSARSSCLLFVLTALFADVIATFDPTSTNARASLARARASTHSLGADFMGRDVLAPHHLRRAHFAGGRRSAPRSLGCLVGIPVGPLSGYFGGWFDLIVQRLIDIMQSLPLLVMALVMAASLGPSLHNTIIAIAIPLVPSVARIIRSNTLSLREMPFVEAARAVGMSEIAHRHPPRAAQHAGAADRAGHRAVRLGDPGRGVALVPRPRRARAVSVLGPHAVGVGGRIRPHRAVARDLSGRRHQPRRVRHQPAGRRAARHARSAAATRWYPCRSPKLRPPKTSARACRRAAAEPRARGRRPADLLLHPRRAWSRRSTACRSRSSAARRWPSSASRAAARA